MKKSCRQQVFSGLCWGFGGTLSFAFSKSPKQRLGACSPGAKQCKVGSQGFVIARCCRYHMTPPFSWAQFELILCNSKSSAAQPRSFSQGEGGKKRWRDVFFLPTKEQPAWKWKLLFSHTWQWVFLFLELYLQLNAVSFSDVFRPFRTSKRHLCWVERSPSSIFLFSAYQAGMHFNIRRLIIFPLSDAGHELLNLSCTCLA